MFKVDGRSPGATALAVVVALLVTTSVCASGIAAGATPAQDDPAAVVQEHGTQNERARPGTEAGASVRGEATVLDGANNSTTVDQAVADARRLEANYSGSGETIHVIARIDDGTSHGPASTRTLRPASLKQTAERSQQPVVTYAAQTDGLAVENRFWLANALLVEVDVDDVNLAAFARQEGVSRLHENYALQVPEPAAVESATDVGTDRASNATYGLNQVNATDVWERYDTRGDGVKVAVLDTGVSVDHPDIDLYTEDASDPTYPGGWAEFTYEGDRVENSTPHDASYHGTHTSGTVAGGNASGTWIGVAPNASLMHGLVLPEDGGTFATLIAGMQWAVEEDADVMSMSLGLKGFYPQLIEPIRNAENAGTVVVAAAGNHGTAGEGGPTGTPGNVYESMGVGASTSDYGIASFSSAEVVTTPIDWRGQAPADYPERYTVPKVVAPGNEILSSVPEPQNYQTISGTSMAAPHVAGVVALTLSAAETSLAPEEVRRVVRQTAWLPSDVDDDQRVAYGNGIVDALAAADRVAAESGVAGRVTDQAGAPISDATVSLDTYNTTTNASGDYRVRAVAGTYDVSVDAFGYVSEATTVDVDAGNFTVQDFTLNATFDSRVVTEQEAGVRAGETITTTLRVAEATQLTVTADGDYDTDAATLSVNGEQVAFGDAVELDAARGPVTITVETTGEASGTLELSATVTSVGGDSVTHETGATTVYEHAVEVGVVDTPSGYYGSVLAAELDEQLHSKFNFSVVRTDDLLASVAAGTYDVYLVQNASSNESLVREFVNRTRLPDVGVVYLDQYGDASDGISQLSAATGDPASVGEASQFGTDTITYEVVRDHPLLEGLAGAGDELQLYEPDQISFRGGYHTYYENWDGLFDAETVARVSDGGWSPSGAGLGVDQLSRTVLAASLGYSSFANGADFQDDAFAVLENALGYANGAPIGVLFEDQPRRADPGTDVTTRFSTDSVEKYKVELADESTIAAENLSLSVNGRVQAFDTWRGFEPSFSGWVNATVTPETDAVGVVALEHTFIDVDGNERTVTTTPTSYYTPPIEVPADVGSIQDAIDLAVPGAVIELADGTVAESVTVDTDGVTIAPAAGETPTVRAPNGSDAESVVRVTADNVTVRGLTVDGADAKKGLTVEDAENATVTGVAVRDATTGISVDGTVDARVTDSTVSDVVRDVEEVEYDDAGLFVSGESNTVKNVTVAGAPLGLSSYNSEGDRLRDLRLVDTQTGARFTLSEAEHPMLADSTVVNATTGVELVRTRGVSLANNTIRTVETGIAADPLPGDHHVTGNDITNASVGVRLAGWYSGNVMENTFAADTGLVLADLSPSSVAVHYNDFSASGVAIEHTHDRELDARLNYLGDRSADDQFVRGDVVTDPFLTAPPAVVDTESPTKIGTAVSLEANGTYSVGVPGPTSATVGEMFDGEFEGAVYGFDAETNTWEHRTADDSVGALAALMVVTESDARVRVHFQSQAAPPQAPGEYAVEEGWNFVAAPRASDIETAFTQGSHDPTVAMAPFAKPASQIGEPGEFSDLYDFDTSTGSGPAVSPFEGYFLFSESEGTIPARLTKDPTMTDLYDHLEIEGETDLPPAADTARTVGSVLAANASENATVDALAVLVSERIQDALSTRNLRAADQGTAAVIADVSNAVVANASEQNRQVVQRATVRAVQYVLADRYDDPSTVGDDDANATALAAGLAGQPTTPRVA